LTDYLEEFVDCLMEFIDYFEHLTDCSKYYLMDLFVKLVDDLVCLSDEYLIQLAVDLRHFVDYSVKLADY
jgi:hypothetical protein